MSDLTENHLLSIFGFGADSIFVGGAEGTMLHYDGVKWESMDLNGRWDKKYMGCCSRQSVCGGDRRKNTPL